MSCQRSTVLCSTKAGKSSGSASSGPAPSRHCVTSGRVHPRLPAAAAQRGGSRSRAILAIEDVFYHQHQHPVATLLFPGAVAASTATLDAVDAANAARDQVREALARLGHSRKARK